VRRFAREMGAELENLLCLAQADITTKRPEKKRRGLRQIEELTLRIRELAALDAVQPPLPSGVGNLIMEAFGIPPSRLIGDIKRALEAAVESGEIPGSRAGRVLRGVPASEPLAVRAAGGRVNEGWRRRGRCAKQAWVSKKEE
jgi:poly(A) polymerase